MLLQAKGYAKAPLVSQDGSLWSWTAAVGPRLSLELSSQWSLTAAVRVRVFLPDAVVAVATESARLALPSLDAALGLSFAP